MTDETLMIREGIMKEEILEMSFERGESKS